METGAMHTRETLAHNADSQGPMRTDGVERCFGFSTKYKDRLVNFASLVCAIVVIVSLLP
jgi:hypothetical protein